MKKFKIKMLKSVFANFGVTLARGKTYVAQKSIPGIIAVYPYNNNTLLVTIGEGLVQKV